MPPFMKRKSRTVEKMAGYPSGEQGQNTASQRGGRAFVWKGYGGSVTRLEQFVKCPYAHFIRYGLCLEEREHFEISGVDHGNIFHKSLEHFSHELERVEKEWQDLTEEEARQLACKSIDYATERYEGKNIFSRSARSLCCAA